MNHKIKISLKDLLDMTFVIQIAFATGLTGYKKREFERWQE